MTIQRFPIKNLLIQEEYLPHSRVLCLTEETPTLDQEVTQLFEQLKGSVYRYLVALFGNPAEAEEIVQEAFLRLYRLLRAGQSVRDVRSWIFRVSHNLAVDQQRGRRFISPVEPSFWDEFSQHRPDARPNPEQTLIFQEKQEKLEAILVQLSPQQRQCLLLRVEGFRHREIAEILAVTVPTVTESLRRCIKKLAKGEK